MTFTLAVLMLSAGPGNSNPQIDAKGFQAESQRILAIRESHRISVDTFVRMARDPDTIILDTRSASAFRMKHIKGAVHLNFSDITKQKLAEVIPDPSTRILIYCNNNFISDSVPFPTKRAPMALNIPTFINLHSYGYTNLYELGPAVDEEDTKLEFEGTNVR